MTADSEKITKTNLKTKLKVGNLSHKWLASKTMRESLKEVKEDA